jgi:type II secretory pathway predicted ATPase ExeA
MDSLRPAVVIITGLPALNNILIKQIHEAIAQRVIVSYRFTGLTRQETEDYIAGALNTANAFAAVFQPAAIEALFAGCDGSIRKLNGIISTALLIGEQKSLDSIDTDTVMLAMNERLAA